VVNRTNAKYADQSSERRQDLKRLTQNSLKRGHLELTAKWTRLLDLGKRRNTAVDDQRESAQVQIRTGSPRPRTVCSPRSRNEASRSAASVVADARTAATSASPTWDGQVAAQRSRKLTTRCCTGSARCDRRFQTMIALGRVQIFVGPTGTHRSHPGPDQAGRCRLIFPSCRSRQRQCCLTTIRDGSLPALGFCLHRFWRFGASCARLRFSASIRLVHSSALLA
jgi:hypothetical protein